jgi:urea transport system ATP-binding protein
LADSILTVRNVNQYYGGSHILRDVSLQAHLGKVTVLLGRNGVGKTTLLKSRALAAKPKLLILDEPTEGIQPSIIKDIGRVIRMLADRGDMAILLVEQYYDFAQELADDYLVMERGEFIARGQGSDMEAQGVRQLVAI